MKEYGELEKQMKKALADLEKREKQLNVNEHEVNDLLRLPMYDRLLFYTR